MVDVNLQAVQEQTVKEVNEEQEDEGWEDDWDIGRTGGGAISSQTKQSGALKVIDTEYI